MVRSIFVDLEFRRFNESIFIDMKFCTSGYRRISTISDFVHEKVGAGTRSVVNKSECSVSVQRDSTTVSRLCNNSGYSQRVAIGVEVVVCQACQVAYKFATKIDTINIGIRDRCVVDWQNIKRRTAANSFRAIGNIIVKDYIGRIVSRSEVSPSAISIVRDGSDTRKNRHVVNAQHVTNINVVRVGQQFRLGNDTTGAFVNSRRQCDA